MFKTAFSAAALAAMVMFTSAATAGEIGRGRLSAMGLGSARVMSDAEAVNVRGKGGFAFGFSGARTFQAGTNTTTVFSLFPPGSSVTTTGFQGSSNSFNTGLGFGNFVGAQGNISFASGPLGTFSSGGASIGGGF